MWCNAGWWRKSRIGKWKRMEFFCGWYKLDLEQEKEKLKPNGERNGQQCCLSIIMMIW